MPRPKTLAVAAKTGDRLEALRVLRDTIARAIDTCESGRDLAALSRQLTDVLAQIAALAPKIEVDVVDEISERRSRRRSSTGKGAPRTKRSG